MKTEEIQKAKEEGKIIIRIDYAHVLIITEEEFLAAKKLNRLNDLFEPIKYFTGRECSFSGDNRYVTVEHIRCSGGSYTVNIQPNTTVGEDGRCYYAPGINDDSMRDIYEAIYNDIKNESHYECKRNLMFSTPREVSRD